LRVYAKPNADSASGRDITIDFENSRTLGRGQPGHSKRVDRSSCHRANQLTGVWHAPEIARQLRVV